MAGALVTSPLDVLKTRLQSDYYKSRPVTVLHKTLPGRSLQHVVDTGRLLAYVFTQETKQFPTDCLARYPELKGPGLSIVDCYQIF